MSEATAATTRNGAAAGTEMRSLSLLAKSAATRTPETSRIPAPKVVTSSTTGDRIGTFRAAAGGVSWTRWLCGPEALEAASKKS